MSRRISDVMKCVLIAVSIVAVGRLGALATPPTKLSEVVSIEDLTAEVVARLSDVEQALTSEQSYRDHLDILHRSATQLAICAQALAEHDDDSRLKASSPDLRDAALAIARSESHAEAAQVLPALKTAAGGKISGQAKTEYEWSKLSSLGPVMSAMKNRSESLRRALRKRGDPAEESRHAMAIALYALVVHDDTHKVKNPDDKPHWFELSLELQRNMTNTARAIKTGDVLAADSFRLGMETCNTCHEKFKH